MYICICTYAYTVQVHVCMLMCDDVAKVTALGVLCCFALFVCLTLLASFSLPSHLSCIYMYMYMYVLVVAFKVNVHCMMVHRNH